MSDYSEFFLNSKSSVVQLELLEISCPDKDGKNLFSQVFRIVRNAVNGVDVRLETDAVGVIHHFDYYPLKITIAAIKDNLDYKFTISFGDLGEVIPTELDNVAGVTDGFLLCKPKMIYRIYRSDNLRPVDGKPLFGPIDLLIETFTFNKDGATFEAKAPTTNNLRTGDTYTLERFPGLRGFL